MFVLNNPYTKDGLTLRGIKWAFSADLFYNSVNADYWQPITFLVRMVTIQLFGTNSFAHHFLNILLHALNTILLFLILFRATKKPWQSAFAAAAFSFHPIQVESVCWVTNLKGVLSAFFGLLATHTYFSYAKKEKKKYYWATFLLLVLGMMCKPTLLTIPFLFLFFDFWPLKRASLADFNLEKWKNLFWEKRAFFAVSVFPLFLAWFGRSAIMDNLNSSFQFSNIPGNFIRFIWRVIYPIQFAILSAVQPEPHVFELAGATILLIWISILVIHELKNRPYLLTGWAWFVLSFLPTIPNVPEDRFAYFPIVGLFLMVAWGIPDFLKDFKPNKFLLGALSVLMIGWYGIFSRIQIGYWRSSVALFEHALEVDPTNSRAYNNLASALASQGSLEKAIEYYTKALWLKPDHAKVHNNLAIILANQGKTSVAKFHYKAAIQSDPLMAEAYFNLAAVLMDEKKYDEAISYYRKSIEIDPENYSGVSGIGAVYVRQEKYELAIPYFLKALAINPGFAAAHHDYGLALAKLGRLKEATEQFTEAIRLQPDFASAHNKLGVTLALQGRFDEALFHLKECLRITPFDKDAAHNLETLTKDRERNQVTAKLN